MIEFSRRVKPSMALELTPHEGQKNQAPLTADNLFALVSAGPAWAVRSGGKLVAVGGHTPVWAGRTVLWGYLAEDAGSSMVAMTKKVRAEVEAMALEFPRIEAYVERHHKPGHRWMRALGLRREGTMRKFMNGRDYDLYART